MLSSVKVLARAVSRGVIFMQVRGRKGMVASKPAWDGWPRLSRDGWPFARYLKMKMRDRYVSKQEMARRRGTNKGRAKQALVGRMADVPEYDVLGDGSSSQAPVVNAAGLRRRLLSTAAEVQSRI